MNLFHDANTCSATLITGDPITPGYRAPTNSHKDLLTYALKSIVYWEYHIYDMVPRLLLAMDCSATGRVNGLNTQVAKINSSLNAYLTKWCVV